MMRWRTELRDPDPEAIRELVAATGFFTAEEIEIAAELATETLQRGDAAGYLFTIVEDASGMAGYACFGRIPLTESSYDLYWIAVHPDHQGTGLGRRIIAKAEAAALADGATLMFVDTAGREQYRPTRAFYEGVGYHVEARLQDFYAPGDDKVIYARRLEPGP